MSWVMTTRRTPGGIDVAVGQIKIASVRFVAGNRAALWFDPATGSGTIACDSVSQAFQKLHRLLNSIPPDEFQIYRKDKK